MGLMIQKEVCACGIQTRHDTYENVTPIPYLAKVIKTTIRNP